MALADWLEIYRSYTGPDLAAEVVSLQNSLKGGFQSQGSGSVSHARDLGELRDRLRAATRVQGERRNRGGSSRMGRVDMSGTGRGDL